MLISIIGGYKLNGDVFDAEYITDFSYFCMNAAGWTLGKAFSRSFLSTKWIGLDNLRSILYE